MLQDLAYGRLENEFRHVPLTPQSRIVCFSGNRVMVRRGEGDTLTLPTWEQVERWAEGNDWSPWDEARVQYVFRIHDVDYFIWMGDSGEGGEGFSYEGVRGLRQLVSKDVCFAIMTAWHLYVWYRDNRFCGRCGEKTVHDKAERMMRCPHCGNMIFPKIAPAVIVAVTNGDRILLSKYAGRAFTRYALLAGFTEIGETAEQTVQREVMEEVGLRVKNIRYYKSQPWGVESDLLMGFFCDLDGDDTIRLDTNELSMAQWCERSAMPAQDDGISLTREMMGVFQRGEEPR